ncbi:MAG: glycosyltransferase [Desulfohalobiaceae bacterium]|nr:glycosyltransferase [Desulfohalobiaceae bacterium]
MILPVFNGATEVQEKLYDLLAQEFPSDHMEIIVVSDGSTDNTVELAKSLQDNRIRVFELPGNQGKSLAQNFGVAQAKYPILFFTDLDSRLAPDCLREVMPYFEDPRVGCVGTNVMFWKPDWDNSGVQSTYGRFENLIRKSESALGVLISLFGSAFAVRRSCFQTLDPDTGDDFIIPLDLALKGYKTVFADKAKVFDTWSAKSLRDEMRVRRRLASRNLLGLWRRREILNPKCYPLLSFSLLSHKILRWFSPFFLTTILLISFILSFEHPAYLLLFIAQIFIYSLCVLGLCFPALRQKIPLLGGTCAFFIAQLGMGWGLIEVLRGLRIHSY